MQFPTQITVPNTYSCSAVSGFSVVSCSFSTNMLTLTVTSVSGGLLSSAGVFNITSL